MSCQPNPFFAAHLVLDAQQKRNGNRNRKKKILMPALAYASMLLVPCGSRSISPFAVMQLVQYHSPLGFYACRASHCTFSVRLTACHHDHHHNQNQNLPALSTSRKTSRHSRVLTPWQLSAASRTMRCTLAQEMLLLRLRPSWPWHDIINHRSL